MKREMLSYLVVTVTLVVLSVVMTYSVIEYLIAVPKLLQTYIFVSLMLLCAGFICGRASLTSEVERLRERVKRLKQISIMPRGDILTLPFDTELLSHIINRSIVRLTTHERVEGVRG